MSEVAVPENRPVPAATAAAVQPPQPPQQPQMTGLVQWAFEAQQANQIAKSLAKTSFVPATMKNKPEDITAAILAGDELGLRPMAALRSMDIIQGTPALRAHAMRGLVQSHGHSVQLVGHATTTRCVMRGRRAGETEWTEVVWTIERAQALGLVKRNPEWGKQPITMLMARATGEICRLIASDVLLAMPYASEELDGYTASAPVAASRWQQPAVTAAEITGHQTAELPPPAPPEAVSAELVAVLVSTLAECGVDRYAAGEVLSDLTQRRVMSLEAMSDADIRGVLELLAPCQAQPTSEDREMALSVLLGELASKEETL